MEYSRHIRRFSVVVHDDAADDLEQLWDTDEDSAALIAAFLEEAKDNQPLLENLSRNRFTEYDEISYNVELWASQTRQKRNLWRLKILSLSGEGQKLRIIYAFDPSKLRYYVLAIVAHDSNFDYEPSDSITKRIVAAYGDLNIPGY